MQIDKKQTNIAFSIEMVIKIADIIVKKFVKNKSIHVSEFDEIKQTIIEKYLQKKDKIEINFTEKSKPETYISAILFRMVLEVLRTERNKNQRYLDFEDNIKIFEKEKIINPEEKLIIQNEKEYLKRVLNTFGKEQVKIILFIKIYYQINITNIEIKNYSKNITCKKILNCLGENKDLKEKEIFLLLSRLQNTAEKKQVKPDAIRMYVNNSIKKILERLNGENNRTFYTKKTLALLFEVF